MNGITDRAGRQLKESLTVVGAPKEQCVRFLATPKENELKMDVTRPDDQTFEYDGQTVLAVDPESSVRTAGQTLDCKEGRFCFV